MSDRYSEAPPSAAPPRRRVLIVDDDPLVRRVVYHLLAERLPGSVVETAADGLAAQVRIPALRPHLIVADLAMPKLNGAALCRWARARGCPRAKLVILTGGPSNGLLHQALDAGADAWFQKPPPVAAFIRTVHRLLAEDVGASASH